jgi:ABC-type nickel/cobalt efflux system permease component RcnA
MRKLSSATPVSIAMLPALASVLCSCQGVVLWGNLAVLAVSVGIFLGTLALGRS